MLATFHDKKTVRKRTTKASNDDEFTWKSDVNAPIVDFTEAHGFRNLPDTLTADSDPVKFLELFLDNSILSLMVDCTNKRAAQTKKNKPNDYYANLWVDVTEPEMRAFLGVRLSMEHHDMRITSALLVHSQLPQDTGQYSPEIGFCQSGSSFTLWMKRTRLSINQTRYTSVVQ